MRYRMYDYDLIGDENGMYSVNDCFRTSFVLEIPVDVLENDRKLISFLKKEGLIKNNIRYSSIDIDGESGYTLYFNYKCNPAFELRREDDE